MNPAVLSSLAEELYKIANMAGGGYLGSSASMQQAYGGSAGGGASMQGGMKGYAKGGIAGKHGPEVALLGEDGPEAVIPLKKLRKRRRGKK